MSMGNDKNGLPPWPAREDIKKDWEPTPGQAWTIVLMICSLFWIAAIGGLGKLFGWW